MFYDYSKSFVTFVTPGRTNNARLQVESVGTLHDADSDTSRTYCFFASCKSESVFVEKGLFQEDNYDFCGIFSDEEYALFRTHPTHTEGFREEGLWKDRFDDVTFDLAQVEAEVLTSNRDIVQASLDGVPLAGTVSISNGRLSVDLQFPIKTMNANDIDNVYQIDTGPIPLPDLETNFDLHVERFSPAYVAYNAHDSADFVIQQPLAVSDTVRVTHYAHPVSLPARTQVLAIRN
jgi:hypothetical protein